MKDYSEQFGAVYDQYIEKIYRFVYLKVNSQEAAEDITSKVFMKCWEAFNKNGDGISNPGAFLYQCARNAVVDHYRAKGRDKTISAEFAPELADTRANIEEKAVLGADIALVKTAIEKLKKDYQDVIIWHYLEDMPITQIAQSMGKPEGTIRVMLHRGLKELRGLVEEA